MEFSMSHIAQKRPFASLVEEEEYNDPLTSSTINSPIHKVELAAAPVVEEQHEQIEQPQIIEQEVEQPPSPPPPPPQVEMTIPEKRFCLSHLNKLMKHKRAIAFLNPVDPVAFNIPDYFDVVKRPMDLGTVNNKLKQDVYPTFQSVLDDIKLIFDNCYLYNNATDPVCQDAKKLEEYHEKQLKKAPAHLAAIQQPLTQQTVPPAVAVLPQQQQMTTQPSTSTPNKIKINLTNNTISNAPLNNTTTMEQGGYSIPQAQPETTIVEPLISTPQASQPESTVVQPSQQQQEQKRSLTVKLPALPTPLPTTTTTTVASKSSKSAADKIELMPDEQFKRCEAIVKELKKSKYQHLNWPFLKPVDAEAWGATDYYLIIKQPMDMTTYERKLYEFEYSTEDELADDIQLMFNNCFQYNPPGHDVHALGQQFKKVFEEYWEKLHQQKRSKASTSTSTSSSKKRRVSRDVSSSSAITHNNNVYQPIPATTTTTTTLVEPLTTATVQPQLQQGGAAYVNNHNATVNHTVNTPVKETEQKSAQPAIKLRLKLGPKPEVKEEKPKFSISASKHAGLAIAKEASNGPKLAIADTPPTQSHTKPAAAEKETKLANEASWYKLATQATATQATPASKYHHTTITSRNSPPFAGSIQRHGPQRISPPLHHKPRISPPPGTIAAPPPAAPPPPPPKPAAPAFDITQTINQITNQKKERERQEKEKQEHFHRNEKIRLEKERIQNEEKLQRIREFNQHAQALREREKLERQELLKHHRCDISQQKMMFKNFFNTELCRDNDWKTMNQFFTETRNYRGFPRLAFVDRSGVDLTELKAKLLSKCGRLRNASAAAAAAAAAAVNNNSGNHHHNHHNHHYEEQQDDGDSDMDVDDAD